MSSNKQSRLASHSSIKTALVAAALISASGVALAAVTDLKGGPIESITILRGTDAVSTTSVAFVDVPEAVTKIKVKAKTLVTARFSAESICQGASVASYCSVQIVATKGGVTTILRPDVGNDFACAAAVTAFRPIPFFATGGVKSRIAAPGQKKPRAEGPRGASKLT